MMCQVPDTLEMHSSSLFYMLRTRFHLVHCKALLFGYRRCETFVGLVAPLDLCQTTMSSLVQRTQVTRAHETAGFFAGLDTLLPIREAESKSLKTLDWLRRQDA